MTRPWLVGALMHLIACADDGYDALPAAPPPHASPERRASLEQAPMSSLAVTPQGAFVANADGDLRQLRRQGDVLSTTFLALPPGPTGERLLGIAAVDDGAGPQVARVWTATVELFDPSTWQVVATWRTHRDAYYSWFGIQAVDVEGDGVQELALGAIDGVELYRWDGTWLRLVPGGFLRLGELDGDPGAESIDSVGVVRDLETGAIAARLAPGKPWLVDVDGDGIDEILQAVADRVHLVDHTNTLLWTRGWAQTETAFNSVGGEGWPAGDTIVRDIDADGDLDVLIAGNAIHQAAAIWLDAATGATTAALQPDPWGGGTLHVTRLRPALRVGTWDSDGDGTSEVLAQTRDALSLWDDPTEPPVSMALPGTWHRIDLRDVDGDGPDDFVVSAAGDGFATWRALDPAARTAGPTEVVSSSDYHFYTCLLYDPDGDGVSGMAHDAVLHDVLDPSLVTPLAMNIQGAGGRGDLDGDGAEDLVGSNGFGLGIRGIVGPNRWTVLQNELVVAPTVVDLQSDGRAEVVVRREYWQGEVVILDGMTGATLAGTGIPVAWFAPRGPEIITGEARGDGTDVRIWRWDGVSLTSSAAVKLSFPSTGGFVTDDGTLWLTGTDGTRAYDRRLRERLRWDIPLQRVVSVPGGAWAFGAAAGGAQRVWEIRW